MGLKTDNPGIFKQFAAMIKSDPTVDILEPCSEWELLRYRREEMVGPPPEAKGSGCFDYGIVYKNKRNQQHYTGVAETDYKEWRNS